MKEATSKFPLKLLDHWKNFMSHWVRSEKKMFWNNSYSRLPIIWGHLKFLAPISLYSDSSSPTKLLVYEIYKKKTWILRKITKNTLIPLYYDSSQILYLSYSTTPCLFYPFQFNTQECCVPIFLIYQDADTIWNKKKTKSFIFWNKVEISNLLYLCKNKL